MPYSERKSEHSTMFSMSVYEGKSLNCLARIRNYGSSLENQALTFPNAQIDALKLQRSAELIEVFRGWWRLPEPLKAAVLAIIRTNDTER